MPILIIIGEVTNNNYYDFFSESIVCGVCSEMTPANKWKFHAMDKHYNVAWRAGETPIVCSNGYLIEFCIHDINII